MPAIEKGISRGQALGPFIFGQDALAASQTDVQIPTAIGEGSQAVDGYYMPFDGEVIAIAWNTSVAATAGTLTIGATVDGTEDADSTVTVTTAVSGSQKIPRGKMRFTRGQKLGAEITTGGTWDGTSADLVVAIYVLCYLSGI